MQAELTKRDKALQRFQAEKLIAIVRTDKPDSAIWVSNLLIDCGFRLIEIPFTVPEAADVIETLSLEHEDAVIGAGTVMDLDTCYQALSAGAEFVVSPALIEPAIQFGLDEDMLVLPGCMTPTEIWKAHTLGASAVKFFPAQSSGGADFISSVKGPLPHIPIVPTGGIQLEHVPDYLKAGALAVGVGGPMLPKALIARQDEAGLRQLAESYLATVRDFAV